MPQSILQADIFALIAQDLACATQCLSVDTFNLLCVTDEPLRTGAAFGSAALSDWQLLHGDLPPLLSNYLLSSR